ncbi:MAG TPA: peptidylprolyl isomerase [Chitinophagaceae bacterium]|nr:peptidylprolyl isomerase [Chitinophagaceae bacterium]
MKLLKYSLITTCIYISCTQTKYKEPTIKIETNFGDIIVELYPEKAPKTVAAFLSYVDSGYYKGGSFYRVLKEEDQPSNAFKSELIQGGIWQTKNKLQTSLKGIPHETTKETGILHENGAISLARTDPGTANSEFFICIGNQPAYNYGGAANTDGQGFAAFGKVIKGMEFVRQIHSQPENQTSFLPPIEIINIIRL